MSQPTRDTVVNTFDGFIHLHRKRLLIVATFVLVYLAIPQLYRTSIVIIPWQQASTDPSRYNEATWHPPGVNIRSQKIDTASRGYPKRGIGSKGSPNRAKEDRTTPNIDSERNRQPDLLLDNVNTRSQKIDTASRGYPKRRIGSKGSPNRAQESRETPNIDIGRSESPRKKEENRETLNIDKGRNDTLNIHNGSSVKSNIDIGSTGSSSNINTGKTGTLNIDKERIRTFKTNKLSGGHPKTKPVVRTTPPSKQLQEIRHVAFLKVHKAASSTVQNIFYRFGFQRNLSFVLPRGGLHYISKSKWNYNHMLPPVIKNGSTDQGKYDILCNHAVFNHDKFQKLLHNDTIYIAIIRNPLDLFISSAYYYRFVWPNVYLKQIPLSNFISELIRHPRKYEPTHLDKSHTFNKMAMDFGFDFDSIGQAENYSTSSTKAYVPKLGQIFRLVMLVERFEESLVLMKRYLKWQLKDILFLRINEMEYGVNFTTSKDLSKEDVLLFNQRNKHDIVIYDFFKARFEKQFAAEEDIVDETHVFKAMVKKVQEFCVNSESEAHVLVVEKSRWNNEFVVTDQNCKLMRKSELPFFYMLCKRRMSMLHDDEYEDT